MYLSRLMLNPRSRQVQHELADPYEMHRTISQAFPTGSFKLDRRMSESASVLFRVDWRPVSGFPILLVQSMVQPDWAYLSDVRKAYLLEAQDLPPGAENPAVKQLDLNLRRGQVLAFRLRANPTVKKSRADKKQGQRVGLYKEDEQTEWLKRKLGSAGCLLISLQISNKNNQIGKLFTEKDTDRRMRFISVQFDGLLQVEAPELLLEAVKTGIGSAKGLGFGLLSLAPA